MLGVYVNHVPQKGSTRFGEVAGAERVRRQGFVGGVRCGIIDWLGVSLWRVCGGFVVGVFGQVLGCVWRRGYSIRIEGLVLWGIVAIFA